MPIPFRAILAFHATARAGSMVEASDSIGVTPSAISQQIQLLEAYFGMRLFSRTGRGVILTEAGERYFDLIRHEVERVASVTEQMRERHSYTVLNVRIAPTFANTWVLPRLPGFITANPDIELHVDATNEPPDYSREAIDLEIRHGSGGWPGLYTECLRDEEMSVLCAPGCAPAGSLEIADLTRFRLLHSVKNVVQWSHWFDAQGVAPPKGLQRALFDRAHMSIDMAVAGIGLALESDLTAQREIADGRLVRPMRHEKRVTQRSLWLVCPHQHLNRRKVQRFVDWLKATLAE
ncbi:LysR substrate-binding domain-containing protein [Aurantimonas litoralis]|nr:LysR substrate-binding domain-containing protein [Aurantimonas litoralis]